VGSVLGVRLAAGPQSRSQQGSPIRHRRTDALAQSGQVVDMRPIEFVAAAAEPLCLRIRRQAGNSPPQYLAHAFELCGRTDPLVSVVHAEEAVSRPVECDGVNIELAPAAVGHLLSGAPPRTKR